MKSSLKLFGLLVVVFFATLSFTSRTDAQTVEQLNAQANWQIALANLATAAGKNNVQVQMVEARAKYLAAQATMITASASANKTNAEALQALEQARSLELDNSLKKAETFYAKKTAHDNYKSLAKPRTRPTPEALLRYSQVSLPQPMKEEELDPVSGKITWPLLLQGEEFSKDRSQIEALFINHLDYNNSSTEAKVLTKNMTTKLRSMIREVTGTDYVKAKNFIRSLDYEFQLDPQAPRQNGQVAINQLVSHRQ